MTIKFLGSPKSLRSKLLEERPPWLVFEQKIENAEELLDICAQIGTPVIDSIVKDGSIISTQYVQAVAINGARRYTSDKFFRISATSNRFDLHTDCASSRHPPRYVFLHCVQPASKGGVSLLSSVAEKLNHLPLQLIVDLKETVYRFGHGMEPVLSEESGKTKIRFNLYENVKYDINNMKRKDPRRWLILTQFLFFAKKFSSTVYLRRNQCLIIDNWRSLHGRSSFSTDSNRLLLRARINL